MKTIVNTIILKGHDLTPIKSNISIGDGKIIEISDEVFEGEIIDGTGTMICPSFLNGHTHIGDSIIKDCGDGKSIEELVKPPNGLKHLLLSECSDDKIISSMKNSMWDMIKTGTTHFIDYREGSLKGIKLLKKAAIDIPITPIVLGRDPIFHDSQATEDDIRKTTLKLLKYCDGIGLSGFSEISKEVCEIVTEECINRNKISSIHVGEYLKLQKKSLKETGKTEIERSIDLNFKLLIHSTYPTNNDLNLISENNKFVTLCPRSNGALNLGIPPLTKFIREKINMLIGTDNIMLNSPNLMREMDYTLKTMRAYYKRYIDPKKILKMATVNGCGNSSNNLDKYNLNFYSTINKAVIEEGNDVQLFITKLTSKNPYLNVINRVETDDVIGIANKDKFLYLNNEK
ncbi:MAG: amidohydrolase family protein [Methanobrevibacter sp.]|jgi:cytosine/adenosine deaminase-related metal-dependent hydrolase|nr:amidohydrolase family protein [Candidatus Methanovirga basalitermitum]